ncbi:hypothetical protein FE207_11970 [Bacillus subtilis]|nr:hypothetical protein [Bacillus subtilis]
MIAITIQNTLDICFNISHPLIFCVRLYLARRLSMVVRWQLIPLLKLPRNQVKQNKSHPT